MGEKCHKKCLLTVCCSNIYWQQSNFQFEILIFHVTTGFNSYVLLWVEPLPLQLPPCQAWGPWALWRRRYYVLNCSRDLRRLRSKRVILLHGWLPVIISHHIAKSGGRRPCRRRDIIFTIQHVTSWDHVIRQWCNFILGFASPHVSTLQRFVAIGILE